MLTKEERERYDRQIDIRGIGEEGQEKLKKARILVAGCGGLGSPALIYLAAAGIGTIRVIDHDSVELSNLNRQVLHWDKDVGHPKVESAAAKLSEMNGGVTIEAFKVTIDETNIETLTEGCDAVVDAMDNLPVRLLLNRTAVRKGIPLMHGAVYGMEGRALTVVPGQTACLACVYHGTVPKTKFPVLGTAPALIAAVQVTEVIKYITGIGKLLGDRLLVYDGLNMRFNEFTVKRDPGCEICG